VRERILKRPGRDRPAAGAPGACRFGVFTSQERRIGMSKWIFGITWAWMIIVGLVLIAGIALSATAALIIGIITLLLGLIGIFMAWKMMKKMPMEKPAAK
jgi:hypothetical protein